MNFHMHTTQWFRGGEFLSLVREIPFKGEEAMKVCAGGEDTLNAGDAYQEYLPNGMVMKNYLTFRQLAEFKLARARGDFKEIGVT